MTNRKQIAWMQQLPTHRMDSCLKSKGTTMLCLDAQNTTYVGPWNVTSHTAINNCTEQNMSTIMTIRCICITIKSCSCSVLYRVIQCTSSKCNLIYMEIIVCRVYKSYVLIFVMNVCCKARLQSMRFLGSISNKCNIR